MTDKYRFVFTNLQGGTSHSKISISEIEVRLSVGGVDISEGANYVDAATYTSGYPPEKTIDNNTTTFWSMLTNSTLLSTEGVWWEIEFDDHQPLVEYVITSRNSLPIDSPIAWKIQRWGDGVWITQQTQTTSADWVASESRTFALNLLAVEAPVFESSGFEHGSGIVTISCDTPDSTIYYTTDGTDPTISSTEYTSPLDISVDTVVKAFATCIGFEDSSVTSEFFEIETTIPPPVISPTSGAYNLTQQITMFCPVEEAVIYYTLDGTDPDTSSILYTGPFYLLGDKTVKAVATITSYTDSVITSEVFTVNSEYDGTVYRHDIINPGAEEGDTTGWSVSHGTVLALEGVAVPPFSGVYYFVGSPGESISGIHQYLNTADANIPNEFIDAGLMSTFISWKQGSYDEFSKAFVRIDFWDNTMPLGGASMIGRYDSTYTHVESGEWVSRSMSRKIPPNTRSIRIVLRFTDDTASPINGSAIDSVSLSSFLHKEIDEYMTLPITWESSISFRRKWKTGIQTTITGYETRSSLYTFPKTDLSYKYLTMSQEESMHLLSRLYKNIHRVWGVPIFISETKLTVDAVLDQYDLVTVSAEFDFFKEGSQCIILQDFETYEIGTIASIDGNTISLVDPLSNTWSAGTSVYPILQSTLENIAELNYITDENQECEVIFSEDVSIYKPFPPAPITLPDFPIYKNYYIFNLSPNFADGIKLSINHNATQTKFLGVGTIFSLLVESKISLSTSYLLDGKEEIYNFLSFFDLHKGRKTSFWLPSFLRDIKLTSSVFMGDTILNIGDIGLATYWNSITTGVFINFRLPNGTNLQRKIISTPSETAIEIESSLGVSLTSVEAANTIVSFLYFVRFDIDEVELQYPTDLAVIMDLFFITVPLFDLGSLTLEG